MITVIETGNVGSVVRAFEALGVQCTVTRDPTVVQNAERLVLPGVGIFGDLMEQIAPLKEALIEFITAGRPFLGICVGLQVLFEESDESPGVAGLCICKGNVRKFTKGKVPQIGWNTLTTKDVHLDNKSYVYFVNSYYVEPKEDITVATTDYNGEFVSAIRKDNVFAVQFHPEKSGGVGLRILERWLEC